MLELSAKMTLVGHACTEIAGSPRRAPAQIGSLFGACCFLADSFIDDFGEEATREYLARSGMLLTGLVRRPKTDRERLFFVIARRLFAERDVLHPIVRQAMLRLLRGPEQDVELRLPARPAVACPRAAHTAEALRARPQRPRDHSC